MDLSQLPRFENTRARFVRLRDLQEFCGWVVGERDLKFIVQLEGNFDLNAGDEVLGEIFVLEWTLKLRAKILQTSQSSGPDGPVVVLALQAHQVNATNGTGKERFRVSDMLASVYTRTSQHGSECAVQDISQDGLGITINEAPQVGSSLRVDINAGAEVLSFQCEVRYARPTGNVFRCGLLIHHNDRIAERKWRRYLATLNERTSLMNKLAA